MSKKPEVSYDFDSFRLDVAERRLLRDGEPVSLVPKVFDTLLVLIDSPGRLVAKDELMSRLWPDTFVEKATLALNISDLRKALGESSGEGKYIETVPKAGYRFVARVARSASDQSIVQPSITLPVVTQETQQDTQGPPDSAQESQALSPAPPSESPRHRLGLKAALTLGAAAVLVSLSARERFCYWTRAHENTSKSYQSPTKT